jgi:hypothetical protein
MKGYGVALSPMSRISAPASPSDSLAPAYFGFLQLARETEDAGFGGLFIPEAVITFDDLGEQSLKNTAFPFM